MVIARERALGVRYTWVLWTREDSHWFAPLDIRQFRRGGVHGKACGGFGGWNDKVWLMDREWAEPMLSMYDEIHTPQPARCSNLAADGAPSGADSGGTLSAVDYLAAPSVEQVHAALTTPSSLRRPRLFFAHQQLSNHIIFCARSRCRSFASAWASCGGCHTRSTHPNNSRLWTRTTCTRAAVATTRALGSSASRASMPMGASQRSTSPPSMR